MKKTTRLIAWVFLIFTAYAFWAGAVLMLIMAHGYSKLPLHMTGQNLAWGLQWPFWIFLLRRRTWAWFPLAAVYSLLLAQWLYVIGRGLAYGTTRPVTHTSPILNLAVSAYALIIVVLPLWALLTDRPYVWDRNRRFPHGADAAE